MRSMFWILVGVTVLAVVSMLNVRDTAMENCQKTHSYDVCFQQLNR
jgi:hypothetical protein